MDNINRKDWNEINGRLSKEYKFKNYKSALEFVNKVSQIAEEIQHHPNINFTWGYVKIEIYTHSENKITEKDILLAKKIDELK